MLGRDENEFEMHEKYFKPDIYDHIEIEGATVSFEHFLHLLYQGREIEFVVDGKEYFIGNFPDGRILCGEDCEEERFYNNHMKMLKEVEIDGQTLENIFKKRDYVFGTIF
ncbi:hypothetical protein [Macrococcus brunensis]|uniref:hypothetical protein n=1 Tax=Macrococcus brunensis TaxID=198483 RepID=UPI001EEFD514|nr:hypothetical protein [Macrococcus brunensis]ULG71234.1 hypothetical protein MGG12_07745 [Macrococcus brunensis]